MALETTELRSEEQTCTLCDLPTPSTPVTAEDIDGTFCCQGCLEASRVLGAAEPEAARSALRSESADRLPADAETAYRAVDGMHCATCEAFVEGVATDREGVVEATASYPAGLLRLAYDPDELAPDDLDAVVDVAGYRTREPAQSESPGADSLGRLLVGGFFGMMAMLWYVLFLYPAYLGVATETLLLDVNGPAGTYVLLNLGVMATVVLFYTGAPILRGALISLRTRRPNMDLLIGLAATTAYAYSAIAALTGGTEVYFDVAIVIILAVTIGNRYEARMRRRATSKLAELAEERAASARRRTAAGTETVPIESLSPGETVLLSQGERVPLDGTVIEGDAAVDESLLTGEPIPLRKSVGDSVIGGARVLEGGVAAEIDASGESTLDRLTELLWEVRSTRPGVQRLADRLATVFVPTVIVLAVLTASWSLLSGTGPTPALLSGLAVLVVSCPCALGLATPLAIASGIDTALDRGVVLRNDEVIERAREIDVVAFDKTGTLSRGEMAIQTVHTVGEISETDLLDRAASLERFADHPVASAIVEAGSPDGSVDSVTQHPGRGVSGTVAGRRTIVGSRALFEAEGWVVPDQLSERCEGGGSADGVVALVGWDGEARGAVVAVEQPRAEWAEVVSDLAGARRVVVISGDEAEATRRFREHPGVDEVFAGVPPEAKTEVIRRLQAEGTVAMIGDGSNDAPALGTADIGIALARGTTLAADAADAVITTDDLRAVPEIFGMTRATRRRIRQNLGWAFLYNAIAIPLAVVGALNPLFAALAMTASSLLVVANSSRALTPTPGSSADDSSAGAQNT